MIQIGTRQSHAIAQDFVHRRARSLSRSADRHQAGTGNEQRLFALHQALADRLIERSCAAGRHLVVDVGHATAHWRLALAGGLPYRETAVAAQLCAVATLGLWWRHDDRLGAAPAVDGLTAGLPSAPDTPEQAVAWARTPWQTCFRPASSQLRQTWPQARYALGRALATGPTPTALRAIADAVFPAHAPERLRRFVQMERRLLAAEARTATARSPLADWCLAGDLALGLGRCIRLLPSLAETTVGAAETAGNPALIDPLKEALRELVG